MKAAKFKIGDNVVLKSGLLVGEKYDYITLSRQMRSNDGGTIEKFAGGDYFINGWWHSEEMLTLKAPSK